MRKEQLDKVVIQNWKGRTGNGRIEYDSGGTTYVKARSKRKKATKGREIIPYGRTKVTRLA